MTSYLPAIGRWVADYYLLATLLLLAVAAVVWCLRQPARRISVAWAAMVALVVLAVPCTFPAWPRVSVLPAPLEPILFSSPSSPVVDQPGAEPPSLAPDETAAPPVADPQPVADSQPVAEGDPAAVAPAVVEDSRLPVGQGPETRLAASVADGSVISWDADRRWSIAAVIFLGGAGLVALRLGWGALHVAALRRRAEDAPPWLVAEFRKVVRGEARPPLLLLSSGIGSAVAVGLLRPTVILPSRLVVDGAGNGLRAALAHEWAHIRNGDLWLLALGRLVFLLMFAHPLYWWLRGRIREDQEALADSMAARGPGPRGYAQALLHWARIGLQWPSPRAAAGLAIWERRSLLVRRVSMLLDERTPMETKCPRLWQCSYLGLLVLFALSLSAVTFQPASSAVADALQPAKGDAAGADALAMAAARRPAGPPLLRYRFRPGQKYVYEVKIVADLGDMKETREGLSTYEVKSATDQQITLVHSGSLSARRTRRDGQPVIMLPSIRNPFFWTGNVTAKPGDLTLNRRGEVIDSGHETSLPYMLGDFQTLAIEPLPAEAQSTWEMKRDVVVFQKRQSRFPPIPRGPFGRFDPFGQEETPQVNRSAHETVTFTIAGESGKVVRIKREYDLRTDDRAGGKPRREMTGEGERSFDLRAGVVTSELMKYEVGINEENLSLTIPVTVTCRLLDPEEAAQRVRAAEEAKAAAAAAAAKANEPRPLGPGEKQRLLAELKSLNGFTVRRTADRLAKAPVEGDPREVAKALEPLLSERDQQIRAAAAKALVVWGTQESVPALIEAADDRSIWVRGPAMEALGRWPTPEAARAVAKQLPVLQGRDKAAAALRAMGAIAEPAVIPLLEDRDGFVRGEACKILQDIGTEKSIPPLEEFAARGQFWDRDNADKAIRAIRSRAAQAAP